MLKTKKSRIFVSSDTIEMVLPIDPPYTTSHQKMINKIIIAYTGLQITNRQVLAHIVQSNTFLFGHDPFLAGQILTVVTLEIVNPDCTVVLL